MNEHIRPMATFKNACPELYKFYNSSLIFEGTFSAKQKENNFYWMYAIANSKIPINKDNKPNSFYWKDGSTMQNKCTVVEMGRLLLYGWYYNNVNFTLELCENIYNAYIYKQDNNITFNDLDFSKAIYHIKDNFIYYYQNKNDLKIYMLKYFFDKEIKKVLPKLPEELKEFDSAFNHILKIKKTCLAKDKDYYYKQCNKYEDYTEYLEDILEQNNIKYLPFNKYTLPTKEGDEYMAKIVSIEKKYQENCNNILLKNNLLDISEDRKQLT